MFEKAAHYLLSSFLGEYVTNLDKDSLKISVWNGNIAIKELELNKDAFDLGDLPIKLKVGRIGNFIMKVPWNNLAGEPIIIEIDDLYMLFEVEISSVKTSYKNSEKLLELKRKELRRIEEIKKDNSAQVELNNSFITRFCTKLLDNLQITVNQVHIRLEDSISDVDCPYSMGIILDQLVLKSADKNWNYTHKIRGTSSASNRISNCIRKGLEISNFGVYWNIEKEINSFSKEFNYVILPTIHHMQLVLNDHRLPIPLSRERFKEKIISYLGKKWLLETIEAITNNEWMAFVDKMPPLPGNRRYTLSFIFTEAWNIACKRSQDDVDEDIPSLQLFEEAICQCFQCPSSGSLMKRLKSCIQTFYSAACVILTETTALIDIVIDFGAFFMELSQSQYRSILSVVSYLSASKTKSHYLAKRPMCSIKENPKMWWNYAFQAISEQMKKTSEKDRWIFVLKRLKDRKLYSQLYEKIISSTKLSIEEKKLQDDLESYLSVEEILAFRKYTEYLTLLKQKDESNSNKSYWSYSNWFKGSNSTPAVSSSGDVWTEVDRNNLYHTIDYDPSSNPLTNTELDEQKYIKLSVTMRLTRSSLSFFKSDQLVLHAVMNSMVAQLLVDKENALHVSLELQDTIMQDSMQQTVVERTTLDKINEQDIPAKYLQDCEYPLALVMMSATLSYHSSINILIQPLDVLLHVQFIQELISFLSRPKDIDLSALDNAAYALTSYSKIQLLEAIKNHRKLVLDLDIVSPTITLKLKEESEKNRQLPIKQQRDIVILLNLGHVRAKSITPDIAGSESHALIDKILYDEIAIKVTGIEALIGVTNQRQGKKEDEQQRDNSYLSHLVPKFSINSSVFLSAAPSDAAIPLIKISGNILSLEITLSATRYQQVLQYLFTLQELAVVPPAVEEELVSSDVSQAARIVKVGEKEKDDDDNITSQLILEKRETLLIEFVIQTISLSLSSTQEINNTLVDKPIIFCQLTNLVTNVRNRTFDSQLTFCLESFFVEAKVEEKHEEVNQLYLISCSDLKPKANAMYFTLCQEKSRSIQGNDQSLTKLVDIILRNLCINFHSPTIQHITKFFAVHRVSKKERSPSSLTYDQRIEIYKGQRTVDLKLQVQIQNLVIVLLEDCLVPLAEIKAQDCKGTNIVYSNKSSEFTSSTKLIWFNKMNKNSNDHHSIISPKLSMLKEENIKMMNFSYFKTSEESKIQLQVESSKLRYSFLSIREIQTYLTTKFYHESKSDQQQIKVAEIEQQVLFIDIQLNKTELEIPRTSESTEALILNFHTFSLKGNTTSFRSCISGLVMLTQTELGARRDCLREFNIDIEATYDNAVWTFQSVASSMHFNFSQEQYKMVLEIPLSNLYETNQGEVLVTTPIVAVDQNVAYQRTLFKVSFEISVIAVDLIEDIFDHREQEEIENRKRSLCILTAENFYFYFHYKSATEVLMEVNLNSLHVKDHFTQKKVCSSNYQNCLSIQRQENQSLILRLIISKTEDENPKMEVSFSLSNLQLIPSSLFFELIDFFYLEVDTEQQQSPQDAIILDEPHALREGQEQHRDIFFNITIDECNIWLVEDRKLMQSRALLLEWSSSIQIIKHRNSVQMNVSLRKINAKSHSPTKSNLSVQDNCSECIQPFDLNLLFLEKREDEIFHQKSQLIVTDLISMRIGYLDMKTILSSLYMLHTPHEGEEKPKLYATPVSEDERSSSVGTNKRTAFVYGRSFFRLKKSGIGKNYVGLFDNKRGIGLRRRYLATQPMNPLYQDHFREIEFQLLPVNKQKLNDVIYYGQPVYLADRSGQAINKYDLITSSGYLGPDTSSKGAFTTLFWKKEACASDSTSRIMRNGDCISIDGITCFRTDECLGGFLMFDGRGDAPVYFDIELIEENEDQLQKNQERQVIHKLGNLSLPGIHLMILNDVNNMHVPLFNICIDQLNGSIAGKDKKLSVLLTLSVITEYYNYSLTVWEPFIEEWKLSVIYHYLGGIFCQECLLGEVCSSPPSNLCSSYCNTFGSLQPFYGCARRAEKAKQQLSQEFLRKESSINNSNALNLTSTLLVVAKSLLNINVTTTMLNVALDFLSVFFGNEVEPLARSKLGSYVHIDNRTGADFDCIDDKLICVLPKDHCTRIRMLAHEAPAGLLSGVLRRSVQLALKPEDEKRNCEDSLSLNNREILRIPIDSMENKVYKVDLENGYSERVICRTVAEEGPLIVRIQSLLKIENHLGIAVRLDYNTSSRILLDKEIEYVSLNLLSKGYVSFCPLPSDGILETSEPIKLSSFLTCGSRDSSDCTVTSSAWIFYWIEHPISTKTDALPLHCLAIIRFNQELQETTLQLYPPIVIENLLPALVQFQIIPGDYLEEPQELSNIRSSEIKPGDQQGVLFLDEGYTYDMFALSIGIPWFHCNYSKYANIYQATSIDLNAEGGGSVRIKMKCVPRQLNLLNPPLLCRLYVEVWMIDHTVLNLEYDHPSIKKEKLSLLSIKEITKKKVIRIRERTTKKKQEDIKSKPFFQGILDTKMEERQWSAAFNIESVGMKGMVLIPYGTGKQYEVGVSIDQAPGKFSRTKLVTFYARYQIINCTSFPIFLKQQGVDNGDVMFNKIFKEAKPFKKALVVDKQTVKSRSDKIEKNREIDRNEVREGKKSQKNREEIMGDTEASRDNAMENYNGIWKLLPESRLSFYWEMEDLPKYVVVKFGNGKSWSGCFPLDAVGEFLLKVEQESDIYNEFPNCNYVLDDRALDLRYLYCQVQLEDPMISIFFRKHDTNEFRYLLRNECLCHNLIVQQKASVNQRNCGTAETISPLCHHNYVMDQPVAPPTLLIQLQETPLTHYQSNSLNLSQRVVIEFQVLLDKPKHFSLGRSQQQMFWIQVTVEGEKKILTITDVIPKKSSEQEGKRRSILLSRWKSWDRWVEAATKDAEMKAMYSIAEEKVKKARFWLYVVEGRDLLFPHEWEAGLKPYLVVVWGRNKTSIYPQTYGLSPVWFPNQSVYLESEQEIVELQVRTNDSMFGSSLVSSLQLNLSPLKKHSGTVDLWCNLQNIKGEKQGQVRLITRWCEDLSSSILMEKCLLLKKEIILAKEFQVELCQLLIQNGLQVSLEKKEKLSKIQSKYSSSISSSEDDRTEWSLDSVSISNDKQLIVVIMEVTDLNVPIEYSKGRLYCSLSYGTSTLSTDALTAEEQIQKKDDKNDEKKEREFVFLPKTYLGIDLIYWHGRLVIKGLKVDGQCYSTFDIHPGDIITKVNGESIINLSASAAMTIIQTAANGDSLYSLSFKGLPGQSLATSHKVEWNRRVVFDTEEEEEAVQKLSSPHSLIINLYAKNTQVSEQLTYQQKSSMLPLLYFFGQDNIMDGLDQSHHRNVDHLLANATVTLPPVTSSEMLEEVITLFPVNTLESNKLQHSIGSIIGRLRLAFKWGEKAEIKHDAINLYVQLELAGIGVSLMTAKDSTEKSTHSLKKAPYELVYGSVYSNDSSLPGIQCCLATLNTGKNFFSLQFDRIQVDNQLTETNYPVLLSCSNSSRQEEMNRNQEDGDTTSTFASSASYPSSFELISILSMTPTLLQFDYLFLRLQPLEVKVEDFVLMEFVGIFQGVKWTRTKEIQLDSLFQSHNQEQEGLQLPAETQQLQEKVYIRWLSICPVKITITFTSSSDRPLSDAILPENMTMILKTIINAAAALVTNLDRASIEIPLLKGDNLLETKQAFLHYLLQHYTSNLLKSVYKIMGSADFLGNPIGLVSALGLGVKEFFYVPAQMLLEDENGFQLENLKAGMTKGSKSLFKNTTIGIFHTTGKITETLGKGVAMLAMDDEYNTLRQQKSLHQRENIHHVGDGIYLGGKELADGVWEGVKGIVQDPVQGAERDGAGGFLVGLGKGLAGFVVKPAAGFLDLLSSISHGVKTTAAGIDTGMYSYKYSGKRVRLPRKFGRDGVLVPFSEREAEGNAILEILKEPDDYIYHVTYGDIKNRGVLMLTDRRIICLSAAKSHTLWQLPLDPSLVMDCVGILLILHLHDKSFHIQCDNDSLPPKFRTAIEEALKDPIAARYVMLNLEKAHASSNGIVSKVLRVHSGNQNENVLESNISFEELYHLPLKAVRVSALRSNIKQNVVENYVLDSVFPFTIYQILVTGGPYTWTVYHRFRDFLKLLEELKDYDLTELPSLPSKTLFRGTWESVIQQREERLGIFLQALLMDGALNNCKSMYHT